MELPRLNASSQQELMASLEIQAQSLRVLAKEIYENIAQLLALAKIHIGLSAPDEGHPIHRSSRLISKVIVELRDLARQPTPDDVKQLGFAQSIGLVLERLERTGLYDISFGLRGERLIIGNSYELVIFCILQDIILQLIADGLTKRLSLQVRYNSPEIIISILYAPSDAGQSSELPDPVYLTKLVPDGPNLNLHINSAPSAIELRIKKC